MSQRAVFDTDRLAPTYFRLALPVVFNINIGHALPRCILPFGVDAVVDAEKQSIRFDSEN